MSLNNEAYEEEEEKKGIFPLPVNTVPLIFWGEKKEEENIQNCYPSSLFSNLGSQAWMAAVLLGFVLLYYYSSLSFSLSSIVHCHSGAEASWLRIPDQSWTISESIFSFVIPFFKSFNKKKSRTRYHNVDRVVALLFFYFLPLIAGWPYPSTWDDDEPRSFSVCDKNGLLQ